MQLRSVRYKHNVPRSITIPMHWAKQMTTNVLPVSSSCPGVSQTRTLLQTSSKKMQLILTDVYRQRVVSVRMECQISNDTI